jgi:hypothetical protein
LDLTGWETSENLLSSALDNATSDGEAGGLLKPEINFASGLTTFVDTPAIMLALRL